MHDRKLYAVSAYRSSPVGPLWRQWDTWFLRSVRDRSAKLIVKRLGPPKWCGCGVDEHGGQVVLPIRNWLALGPVFGCQTIDSDCALEMRERDAAVDCCVQELHLGTGEGGDGFEHVRRERAAAFEFRNL